MFQVNVYLAKNESELTFGKFTYDFLQTAGRIIQRVRLVDRNRGGE
jgi:hypothetical protein